MQVTPERTRYVPGETVKATVTTTDEHGTPIPAVTGVVVVNEAVLSYAQDRDTPDLPMHFLLGLEVEELEEVQLFAEGIRAQRAVDLLLGVQGWRRFAWKDADAFTTNHPDHDAARAIVAAPLAEVAQPISFSSAKDTGWRLRRDLRHVDQMVTGIFFTTIFFLILALIPVGLACGLWFTIRTSTPNRRRRMVGSYAVALGAFLLLVMFIGSLAFTSLGSKMAPGSALRNAAVDMATAVGAEKFTEDKAESEMEGEWDAGGDPMAVPEDVMLRTGLSATWSVTPTAYDTVSDQTKAVLATLQKELERAGSVALFTAGAKGDVTDFIDVGN
ncbi:MAG: hypothetical protein ACYTGX_15425 [Planctomycetota bacterium]